MSTGVDIPIDDLVLLFNTFLWTGNENKFYGRIFRDNQDGKIRPLVYEFAGSDPVEVLWDDQYHAQCFFDVIPSSIKMFGAIKEAEVRLMFMVNRDEIYPELSKSEAAEQIIEDVENLIKTSPFDFIRMIPGKEAFNEYNWSESSLAELKGFLFRFDLKLVYNN